MPLYISAAPLIGHRVTWRHNCTSIWLADLRWRPQPLLISHWKSYNDVIALLNPSLQPKNEAPTWQLWGNMANQLPSHGYHKKYMIIICKPGTYWLTIRTKNVWDVLLTHKNETEMFYIKVKITHRKFLYIYVNEF